MHPQNIFLCGQRGGDPLTETKPLQSRNRENNGVESSFIESFDSGGYVATEIGNFKVRAPVAKLRAPSSVSALPAIDRLSG